MSVITRLTGLFKKDEQAENTPTVELNEVEDVVTAEEKNESVATNVATETDEDESHMTLKCVKHGKEVYIKGKLGMEVYDTRSKRRIGKECGKNNFVRIFLSDRVVMGGKVYLVESITTDTVNLKKVGPWKNTAN